MSTSAKNSFDEFLNHQIPIRVVCVTLDPGLRPMMPTVHVLIPHIFCICLQTLLNR